MTGIRIKTCMIFVSVLAVWLLAGAVLHRAATQHNNHVNLQETADLLIQRVEKSIDFVVIAATELLLAGQARCSDQAVDLLRQMVLRTGTVADIYMVTDQAQCSSFDELSADFPPDATRQAWMEARNPSYRIGAIASADTAFLGVSYGFGSELELVSAINADAILFDVLANELRANRQIDLIGGGQVIDRFGASGSTAGQPDQWVAFQADGQRYPVSVEIRLDPRHGRSGMGPYRPCLPLYGGCKEQSVRPPLPLFLPKTTIRRSKT